MAKNNNVDPSKTIDDFTSQLLMKIQSTKFCVQSDVTQYLEDLQMLIVSLQNFVMSMTMFSSFLCH